MGENDSGIWRDILQLQLEGVMTHIALLEKCQLNELDGFSCMHSHHAQEEFEHYLDILENYLKTFKEVPDTQQILSPSIQLDGTTVEEKMMACMEIYRSWETEVLSKLQKYQVEMTEAGDEITCLIQDVRDELKCINLIQNDLLDEKYEELNCWCQKKWGD